MKGIASILKKSQTIHISHVRYADEKPLMKLRPNESRNYHGHCFLDIKSGSAEVSSPMEGCYTNFNENGEINMLVFTLTAGAEGCEFSIRRPMLEALKK